MKKEVSKLKSNPEESKNIEKINTINFINESLSSDFDEEYREKDFMSWECLPFSSKRSKNSKKLEKKQNIKTKESKKKRLIKISNNDKKEVKENCFSSEIVDKIANIERKEFKKTYQHIVPTITNSSFGFDLQGGILENQLTFIMNVHPNGNAAKKGLKNGDILVSIQNKIVIGINRNEIEKLLNKYTVEDEIEIVICRLKNPAYILNLYKMYSEFTYDNNMNLTKQFHSLNDQLYSELISFQKLLSNDFKKSGSLDSHSISLSSSKDLNQIGYNEKLPNKFEENKVVMNVNCSLNEQGNKSKNLKAVDHSKNPSINSNSQLRKLSNGKKLTKSFNNPSNFPVALIDKICGKSQIGSAGNHLSTNKGSNKVNDFILISVSQKTPQIYHPQIKQNVKHINMKPMNFYSVKSTPSSINDFTGSILNAERENNLIRKQTKLSESKSSETYFFDKNPNYVKNLIEKHNDQTGDDNSKITVNQKGIFDTTKNNATANYNYIDQKNSKNHLKTFTIKDTEFLKSNLKNIRNKSNKLLPILNLSQNKRKTTENDSSSKRKKYYHLNNLKWQNEFANNNDQKKEENDETNLIEIPIIIPIFTTNFEYNSNEKMILIKSPIFDLDHKCSKIRSLEKKDYFKFPKTYSLSKNSNMANDGNINFQKIHLKELNNQIVTLSKFLKKNTIPYKFNCNDPFVSFKPNILENFESSCTKLISLSNPINSSTIKLVEVVIPRVFSSYNIIQADINSFSSTQNQNKFFLQSKDFYINSENSTKKNSFNERNDEKKKQAEEKSKIKSDKKSYNSLMISNKSEIRFEKNGHDSNSNVLNSTNLKINEFINKEEKTYAPISYSNEKRIELFISKKRAHDLAKTQTQEQFEIINSIDSYESISDSECLLLRNTFNSTKVSKSLTSLRDNDEIDYLGKCSNRTKFFPKEIDKILNTEKPDLIFDWNQNASEHLIVRNNDFACNSIDFSIEIDSSLSDQSDEKLDSTKNDQIPKLNCDFETILTSSSILSNTLNDSDGTKQNLRIPPIENKNHIFNKNSLSNTSSSSLRASLVFDDGYDSTVSCRNTTESFSSMEEIEINRFHFTLSDKKSTKLHTKNFKVKSIDSLYINNCWEDFLFKKEGKFWMNKSNLNQCIYLFGNKKDKTLQIENYLIQDCFRVINNIIKKIELLQAHDNKSCIEKNQDSIKNNENYKNKNDYLFNNMLNPMNESEEILIDPNLFYSVNVYIGKNCITNDQVQGKNSEFSKCIKHNDKNLQCFNAISQKKIIQKLKMTNEIKNQNYSKKKKTKKLKFLREFEKDDIDIYLIPPIYSDNYMTDFDERNENIEKQSNRLLKNAANHYLKNFNKQFKSSASALKLLTDNYNLIFNNINNVKSTFVYSNNSKKEIRSINYPRKNVVALNFIPDIKEFSKLNDILAFYIEKLKILEAQNKKMKIRLDILKNNEKIQTLQIQEMYIVEIEEAKKVLDDIKLKISQNEAKTMKAKNELQSLKIKNTELDNIATNNKFKIIRLQNNLLNCEKEISFMTRKFNDLKKERTDLKQIYSLLFKEINATSNYLEQEVSKRIDLEYKKHILEQEIRILETNQCQQSNDLQKKIFNQNYFDTYYYNKNYLVNNLQKMREEHQQHYLHKASMLDECYNSKITKLIRNFDIISSKNKFPNQQLVLIKERIDHSKENIIKLKYDNILLENKIKDVEDQLKHENYQSLILMRKKEEEIFRLKNNICETNKDYERFICYKKELEKEINMFKNLSDW